MLSPDLEAQLATARDSQSKYVPGEKTAAAIHDKTLVMLVSPVAVGKSFVIDHTTVNHPDFKAVSVFTTRDARPNEDRDLFKTIPHDNEHISKIIDDISKGRPVQYAVHPTSGRIYLTYADDYPGEFNLLATLSGAVNQLRTVPFKRTVTIGLSTDPTTWQKRLALRYPEPSEEKTKRLAEAITSLRWLLDPVNVEEVRWVSNPEVPDAAVKSIVDIVKYNQQGSLAAKEDARQMLQIAEELI